MPLAKSLQSIAGLLVAALPLAASVRIEPNRPTVTAGEVLDLVAHRPAGLAHPLAWYWEAEGAEAGLVSVGAGAGARFHAPPVDQPRICRVRVSHPHDPSLTAVAEIRVVPDLGLDRTLVRDVFPKVLGEAWTDVRPRLSILGWSDRMLPEPAAAGGGAALPGVQPSLHVESLAFLHCPERPDLDRRFLVAGTAGLFSLDYRGRLTPLAAASGHQPCLVAARPAAAEPGNPFVAVFIGEQPGSRRPGLFGLDLDDQVRPLFLRPTDGSVALGQIQALVLDPQGRSLVAAGNLVWRFAPDGTREVLATFQDPVSAMTRDPATGHLYVASGSRIWRLDQGGAAEGVLGGDSASPAPAPGRPRRVAAEEPCLGHPNTLQVLGQHLLFTDSADAALVAYDLRTGDLATLAGSERRDGRPVEGLLAPYRAAGDRSPSADLGAAPVSLALDDQGNARILVSGPEEDGQVGFLDLDLALLQTPPAAPVAAAAAARAAKSQQGR